MAEDYYSSEPQLPSTAEGWRRLIERAAGERSDLDALLKDQWRHKVAVRDVPRATGPTSERQLVVDGPRYFALVALLRNDPLVSLGALALAAFHTVLMGYGHGSRTVIAYVDAVARPDLRSGKVLPSILDRQPARACIDAVRSLERSLRRAEAFVSPVDLLERGLFDTVLVLADEGNPLADMPPFPLSVVVRDCEARASLQWTVAYAATLFEDEVIAGVLKVVREVLHQLVSRPGRLVGDLELVSDEQKRQLDAWNATDGDFPSEKRLDELFEDAVKRSPKLEAIVCENIHLTYGELNERCNRLARWLRGAAGVQPQELIALYLDKSELVIVATLGIWKAGAAFVPIDLSYPAERVRFTVRDTQTARVVTNRHHAARLREMLGSQQPAVQIIEVETVLETQAAAGAPHEDLQLDLGSEQLAYVTYTSGTTGVPKGVPKNHRSVVNSITDLSERYDMRRTGEERVALFAAYVFEPFMRQTLIALINSQTLVVVPDEVKLDPQRLPAFVTQHGITYLNGTGSVLRHFDLRGCTSLKRMLLVGEELTASGLCQLRERFDGRIINEYAFTETAFVTAIKEFAPGVAERPNRSIGRPLRNVKCYVVSQNLKQVPIGAVGELYIGGCGVARGYLNREALTAERFWPNPFQKEHEKRGGHNARIYKTGDLARVLPNGELEFMGRSDFQLKLNGVRVEPGEIEARATEYPGVRQCIVVPREGPGGPGDRHLIGYFVAEESSKVTEADLRAFLGKRLIRGMVPARMVRLPRLPVNVNGKVDRLALPDVTTLDSAADISAPGGASEPPAAAGGLVRTLRNVWSAILGVPSSSIQAHDDFFMLGGHSISCIQLITRVWQQLRLILSVEDVFKLKTLEHLAAHLERQALGPPQPGPSLADAVTPTAGQSLRLRANGLQQGLMYQALKKLPGDAAYVVQSVYRYRCAIRPELLERAWRYARRKYPALGLRFEWGDGATQLVGAHEPPLYWRFIDLSAIADDETKEARVRKLQEHDRAEPYDLAVGPLFRVYLIKQRDDRFALIFSCHHIILDGWSLPILHDDVNRMYLQLVQGAAIDVTVDVAYLAAQRYWEAHRGDHVDYWMEQVERIAERGDFNGLLAERSRYKVALSGYDHVREHRTRKMGIGASVTAALKATCAAERLTLHSVVQFVWHEVLHAIGGARTTVVGTIVSGRNLPIDGIEGSVGLFINTLPLVVDHDEQATKTVAAAVAEIQEAVNRMNGRSTVELARLQSGEMKRQLFDTLLVLENYPRLLSDDEARWHREQLCFEHHYDSDKVDYPLAVVAREEDGELTVNLWYAGELFDDSTIDTLLDVTRTLFHQVAEDFSQRVRSLAYVSAAAQANFDAWNCTDAPFLEDQTLHGKFEEVAARWPGAVAVVCGGAQLTYSEVNARANELAYQLSAAADLRPNDIVGLVMDKSEWMIVAILAVWKAGAAYVPIDPDYPDDRITFMLNDTRARLVVANEAYGDRLRGLPGDAARPVLSVERLPTSKYSAENPVTGTISTDLAYAIYTSGTTGRPKAVLVEHRGVLNLHTSLERTFTLRRGITDEAILSFSNYVFDHFVEQMTDALLSGQKLVVLDDEMRTDKERLYRYLNDHSVTYLSGTPSVLSTYEFSTVPSLTRIDAIGEDLTVPVFNRIRKTFGGMIINGYGPTEISITSHKRLYGEGEPRLDKSIGYPVANTRCYVLDGAMRRLPVGGVGELYIGGVGVARGYLNREDLTAERFLSNPFRTPSEVRRGTNARIYKTGDLVRWLPNGEIEYLGRNDLQVKIRGQRVELGEIEGVLASYAGVSRAIVVAREHGAGTGSATPQKYLVGFYLGEHDLPEQDVLRWMRTKLPRAVVPVRVLRIAAVPLTRSGKLDVGRLPETDFVAGSGVDYFAPSSDLELELCRIWSMVLGIAPELIGVRDDFFGLGGDSLRGMELAQAISGELGSTLGVATVFEHTTIQSQARHIEQSVATPNGGDAPAVRLAALHTGDPQVSLAQERLLFIDDFVGGTAAYNIPFVVEVETSAVIWRDALASALRTLVRRHPALRTLLRGERDGVRLQRVLNAEEALARFEVSDRTVGSRLELDAMLVADAGHVFRLDEELPIRCGLFNLVGVGHKVYVSIVVHHTCFDGWSWGIFRRELAALASGAAEAELPRLRASYADFALWQRHRLSGGRLSALTGFWMKALAGFEPLDLPLDKPRPPQFDYCGREVQFDLDASTLGELKALARSARVSLYCVLLGAYCLLLRAYTGQDDIVVGTPSANRVRPEFTGVIGFFANLLVLRIRVDGASTLSGYLRTVGETVIQAQVYQELPFEQLVKSLRVEKDASRHPVVQVVFGLLSDDAPDLAGRLPMQGYAPDNGGCTTVKFDLSTTVTEVATGLAGSLTYAASLFDAANIRNFVASFRRILTELARLGRAATTTLVSVVNCDDAAPTPELLAAVVHVAPRSPSSGGQTLHGKFEEMAARWPDAVAVVCGGAQLTYSEVNARANELAYQLSAAADLRPNDIVGLVMDKSERMIVAILAVWKAGAAYVPIDPGYPDDRIAFMLDDTRARLVVADEAYGDRLRRVPGGAVRPVLSVEWLPLSEHPAGNPATGAASTDLAYAIYTSGTTGRPKAVLVEHRNVVSLRNDLTARYFGEGEGPRQAVLFLSNYVFDFSIEQLVLSILSGHKLVIPPTLIPGDDFYDYANRNGLTYLSGTPTQVQQFNLSRLGGLRLVLVAGESFQTHHFDKIRRGYSGPLLNAYGTTETTVYNTVRRFEPGEPHRNDIGEPLSNTRLYVLGSEMQALPTGAVGELFVAGDCVSAGYLDRAGLMRERFVPNPHQTEDERREGRCAVIYRTGDCVRRRVDGALEFLGRNDSQVKIHGVRVELGEVEAVLASHPGVGQCAVVAREHPCSPGSTRLVGYYVANGVPATDGGELLRFLRAKLAPSTVPALLVRIEGSLPITTNGKLDTAALPSVDDSAEGAIHVAPRSRLEARLCEMWSRLLPGSALGVDDDFFRCGGDSITALQLASQVQRETGRKVSVKHIFDFPTIRSFVEGALGDAADDGGGDQGPLIGTCPMLPIQEWFFTKPLTSRGHWNQYFAIRTSPLDIDELRGALDRLVDHHDVFRLRYRFPAGSGAGQVEQFYADGRTEILLRVLDVKGFPDEEFRGQLERWQSGFDLERGPLCCAAYLHGFDDGSARVWIAMHHLIIDAVSWRILTQDLEILYHGGDLGPRGTSYRQWTQALRSYPADRNEARLWAEVAEGVAAELRRAPLVATGTGSCREHFALSERETRTLLLDSNCAYDTHIMDLMLTALGFAVREVTRQASNHVAVEGHGREEFAGAPDVRDTVGWFTTMHPVLVAVTEDLGRSIALTKTSRRRAPHNGIGYGAIRGTYGGSPAPLPSVSFNYLGQFVGAGIPAPGAPTKWHLDPVLCGSSKMAGDQRASDCAVDVCMRWVGGRMVADVDSRLDEAATHRFTATLKARLEEIIAHTSAVAAGRSDRAYGAAARTALSPADGDAYILANEGESGPMLFVLPPGEGGAESYLNNLARQLPGLRLVLFNNVHLHRPMQSFEALARHYLTHVRRLQPSGPYSLLGWSFGGVLSLEMALQLTRAGETISNLLLIDSFFDVKKASAAIGMPHADTILDPIHHHYMPYEADLERLHARTNNVVLFKATERSDALARDDQRRLFDYYARSPSNNLDTLLPTSSFMVEVLPNNTHFSWVRDEPLVAAMGSRIRTLVLGT